MVNFSIVLFVFWIFLFTLNIFLLHEANSSKHLAFSHAACREMKADIMFLVDSSGSIGHENFIKMKTFMKNLVRKSQIGADRVQIGVVQFSDINKEEFQLNKYISQSEISDAIDQMAHIGKTTLTGDALKFVSQYFSPTKGARPDVRKFLILITDGEAQDAVKDPAVTLRQEGIIIYSVGVFGSNVAQLEEISGRPEMVFYVENFDILQRIEDDLVFGVCSPHEGRPGHTHYGAIQTPCVHASYYFLN